jgi:hypothetical protein
VRTVRPLLEHLEVARLQWFFAARRAQRHLAGQDESHLLLAVVVVVRTDRRARRQLVQRRAEQLAAEPPPDVQLAMLVTGVRLLLVPDVAEEVDDLGHSPSQ